MEGPEMVELFRFKEAAYRNRKTTEGPWKGKRQVLRNYESERKKERGKEVGRKE